MAGFTSWIRLILYVYENNNRDCVILNVILSLKLGILVKIRLKFSRLITSNKIAHFKFMEIPLLPFEFVFGFFYSYLLERAHKP